MSTILECKNLSKKYGRKQALDNITLSLESGKIIGLLGPNGSGKTTLIKLINGLLAPTGGKLFINGNTPGVESKKIVSYLPERTYLDETQKVSEAITLFEDFYKDFDRSRAISMLEKLNIDSNARRADCRSGPCCKRLHFKYDYQQLRTRFHHPHLHASYF